MSLHEVQKNGDCIFAVTSKEELTSLQQHLPEFQKILRTSYHKVQNVHLIHLKQTLSSPKQKQLSLQQKKQENNKSSFEKLEITQFLLQQGFELTIEEES